MLKCSYETNTGIPIGMGEIITLVQDSPYGKLTNQMVLTPETEDFLVTVGLIIPVERRPEKKQLAEIIPYEKEYMGMPDRQDVINFNVGLKKTIFNLDPWFYLHKYLGYKSISVTRQFMGKRYKLYPGVAYEMLTRFVALELDLQYGGHIREEEEHVLIDQPTWSIFTDNFLYQEKPHWNRFSAFRCMSDAIICRLILQEFRNQMKRGK